MVAGRDPEATLFEEIFHGSQAVKLLLDPDTAAIVDANPAAIDFYGHERDALLDLRIFDLNTLPEDKVRAEMQAARKAERKCFHFQHRLANGRIRDVEVFSSSITLNQRTYLLSIIHDVTARNDQERELAVLDDIVDNLPVGLYRSKTDEGGRFLSVNREMVRITEADSEQQLLATPASDLYAKEGDREGFIRRLQQAEDWHQEIVRLKTLKGNSGVYRLTVRRRLGEDGETFIDGIVEDISQIQAAEQSRQHLYEIIDATPAIVGISASDGRLMYLNQAGRKILGLSTVDPLDDFKPRRVHTDDSFQTLIDTALPTVMEKGHWIGEMSFRNTRGEVVPVQTTLIAHKNEDGELLRISAVSIDVSSQKRRQEVLEQMAFRDSLTGVLNRRGFMRALKDVMEDVRSSGEALSVLMVDLDHFKPINDKHGHAVGDEILRTLAPRLSGRRRKHDLVGRLGGEEFGIMLPGATRDDAIAIAEAIRERIVATSFKTEAGLIPVTASIGVACLEKRIESGPRLLHRADEALYDAKRAGRNCVRRR